MDAAKLQKKEQKQSSKPSPAIRKSTLSTSTSLMNGSQSSNHNSVKSTSNTETPKRPASAKKVNIICIWFIEKLFYSFRIENDRCPYHGHHQHQKYQMKYQKRIQFLMKQTRNPLKLQKVKNQKTR